MDWKMIGVCFQLFQFIFMAVIFAVLKFNDMNHLDKNLNELKISFNASELKIQEHHIENLKSINALSLEVSKVVGRLDGMESK